MAPDLNMAELNRLALIGLMASILSSCLWLVFSLAFLFSVFASWVTHIHLSVIVLCALILLAILVYLWFALTRRIGKIRAAAARIDSARLLHLNSTPWTITAVVLSFANVWLGLVSHVLDEVFVGTPLANASLPLICSIFVVIVGPPARGNYGSHPQRNPPTFDPEGGSTVGDTRHCARSSQLQRN
jgi:hypothetical protein